MFYVTNQISEHISETPQGFLLCRDVPIARTGRQDYYARELGMDDLPPHTVVTVDRLEQDVFAPEVLASFEGSTVTLLHPDAWVTTDNWRKFAMGHIQNVRRGTGDTDHLIMGDMLITDPGTIARIKSGVREVSCGYDCRYVQDSAGNWRQTEIRGNHVAIVPRGRAGAECSIKDSLMTTLANKIRTLFGRAQDEALAELAQVLPEGVTADPAPDPAAVATGDADMTSIIADLQQRLAYAEQCAKEMAEQVDALAAAIAKLTDAPEPAAVATGDATPVTLDADTIARAEILAPGIAKEPGVQGAALLAAYATVDGKKAIDALNGGKAPTLDDADRLFVAASELIKVSRAGALQATPAPATPVTDAAAYLNKRAAEFFPLA